MADSLVANANGVLTATTAATDLTISGETRTPNGCVVFCGYPTSTNTNTTHANICVGFSDFTDSFIVEANCEDGQTTTDCHRSQTDALIIDISDTRIKHS